jgi:hypothetical protein
MKNIALCIHGYFSNKDNDNLLLKNYIYDNIISKIISENNIYIFIHSFDIENKSKILVKYPSVTNSTIEPQIDFTKELDEDNKEFVNAFLKENPGESWFSTLSFLYSRKQSILLAIEHSNLYNINYHHILVCRFDVGIRCKKVEYTGTNPCHINNYDPNIENESLYSRFWTQINAGYADYWFFSNPTNMLIVANMYDYVLNTMFKLNSDYIQTLTTNWPHSNKYNAFSNEILSNTINNIEHNTKYNFVNSSNNHLLYKYYFMKTGLFYKTKYI